MKETIFLFVCSTLAILETVSHGNAESKSHGPSTLINLPKGDKQERSILVDEAKKLDVVSTSPFTCPFLPSSLSYRWIYFGSICFSSADSTLLTHYPGL